MVVCTTTKGMSHFAGITITMEASLSYQKLHIRFDYFTEGQIQIWCQAFGKVVHSLIYSIFSLIALLS